MYNPAGWNKFVVDLLVAGKRVQRVTREYEPHAVLSAQYIKPGRVLRIQAWAFGPLQVSVGELTCRLPG